MPDTVITVEAAGMLLRGYRPVAPLLGFMRALLSADLLPHDEVLYFLDRPEKWATEFAWWRAYGNPEFEDDEGFAEWKEACEEHNS